MQWVPEAYADEPIEWSPVLSLTTGDRRFVPSAAVYLSFRGEGARFCKGDSNGLSSGNTIEEAILQGLLELVERDAVALWWYNRVRVPALDLESFDDRYLLDVRGCYERLGRRVWALDLTTDLGVPCFAALAARRDQAREEIIFGFGAHLDARIALSRAVTELNQMLPSVLRTDEERRAQLLPDFADVIRWWNHATLKEHRHLMPAEGLPLRRLNDFSTPARDDLREDVLDCVARVYSSGVDVLVHNLTRADVGLAVARVFAPGLRHFWRRLAPGRLYEVPVRLGWLAEPLREQELNPVSLFV
jgi:ribosomal protein S12 methylthiotransferase accessory factor